MRPLCFAVALAAVIAWPIESEGQRAHVAPPARRPVAALQAVDPLGGSNGPLVPAGLSLVIPGAGQHVLEQNRKWAYLALELGGWAFYFERRRAGGDYRDRYRDFAWDQARVQGGARVDGDFEYYEVLTHWGRSGAFDRDAAGGLQPELDPATFNGSVWSLAAAIYLSGDPGAPDTDPSYASALAYYAARAYGPEMLWDWSGVPGAQAEFSGLVDASDRRFRQATTLVGVVIANHLLSAVDAYVSSRGIGAGARIQVAPAELSEAGWGLLLSIPTPR